jgi:hypothetical protein
MHFGSISQMQFAGGPGPDIANVEICFFARKTQVSNFISIAKVSVTTRTGLHLDSLESLWSNFLSIVSEFSRWLEPFRRCGQKCIL